MPVFNGADQIARAINSVKAQTFRNWRLLIVNNASTDHTLEVARQVGADPRIEIVSFSDHVSALSNFRRALRLCRSEYACFLAHDDHWGNSFLAELVGELRNSPTTVGACPRVILLTESGEVPVRIRTRRWRTRLVVDRRGLISIYSQQVNAWYGLYRLEYLRRVWEAIDPIVREDNPASDRAYVAALLSYPVIYCERALLFKSADRRGARISPRDHRDSNRQVHAALQLQYPSSVISEAFLGVELLYNNVLATLRASALTMRKRLRVKGLR